MEKNKKELNEKKHKIITIINFAIYLLPLVVMLPLISLHTILVKKMGVNMLGNILLLLFFICALIYLIGLFTGPLIQLVLMIIAITHKNWRWVVIHIVSAVTLCGGIALLYKIVQIIAYAN